MKILLTVHQFFPDFSDGTETLTYSVARELVERNHEVRIFTAYPTDKKLDDTNRFDEYVFEGITIYRFYYIYTDMGNRSPIIEYDNYLTNLHFQKILEEFQPNVVHFFHLGRLGSGLINQSVQANIPAFMTPTDFWVICSTIQLLLCDGQVCLGPNSYSGNCIKHYLQNKPKSLLTAIVNYLPTPLFDYLAFLTHKGWLPAYPQQEKVKATVNRLNVNIARLNQLTCIISPTSLITKLLIKYGVAPERIKQSAFGINGTEAYFSRSQTQQPLRIGFIGTLCQHKGCHVLIEAFKELPLDSATLDIYGKHTYHSNYIDKLKKLANGNPNISFRGTFPNANIANIFAELDVLVVPSLWYENTPLVIYSAQAARCPVIASDFAGLSEVIEHEDNGLLFKAGDVAELSKQLMRLVVEPQLLEQLSNRARPPKSTKTYVDELLEIWHHQCA